MHIGHNSNSDFRGYGGRLVAWRKARHALLPKALPIEVIRRRVARAAALGLDYKAYASLRAATGRDIIALLFSTNALGMLREARLPSDRAAFLDRLEAGRFAAVQGGLDPSQVAAVPQIDGARIAPRFMQSWSSMSDQLLADLRAWKAPTDGTLIIGTTAFEREWCAAARAAGYVSAERYFGI